MNETSAESLAELADKQFAAGNLPAARTTLEQLHLLSPQDASCLSNLSYTEFLLGDLEAALAHCNSAIEIDPHTAAAHENLAAILGKRGDHAAAFAALEKGLRANPGHPNLLASYGLFQLNANRFRQAIESFQQAIRTDPRCVQAHCNLGIALLHCGRADKAVESLRTALIVQPDYSIARSNLLLAQQYLPDVSAHQLRPQLDESSSVRPENPAVFRRGEEKPASNTLKIGFVSSDFNKHPVGYFLQTLFAQARAPGYQFYCYYNAEKEDSVSNTLRTASDHWHHISGMNDTDAARLVKDHGIDVLVDLNGHTENNRLGLFALRPAATQVSWLGYFASTGLPCIDYVLLNADQAPMGCEHYYTEDIHRLESCQFNYAPPAELKQEQHALPPQSHEGILFASFNNLAKINSEVIATWSEALRQIPTAHLKLKWRSLEDPSVQDDLAGRFARHGIERSRLLFAGATEHQQMLREYLEVDVALDTFPFSGALTSCEALWMGVPVVSLRQLRPVSRQTWSILKSLGLEDLCSETRQGYVDKIVELARDDQRRKSLRGGLREKMARCTEEQSASLAAELFEFFESCKDKKR